MVLPTINAQLASVQRNYMRQRCAWEVFFLITGLDKLPFTRKINFEDWLLLMGSESRFHVRCGVWSGKHTGTQALMLKTLLSNLLFLLVILLGKINSGNINSLLILPGADRYFHRLKWPASPVVDYISCS